MLDQRSALSYRSTGDTPTNSHAYPPPTSHTCTHKELFVFLLSHVNKFCVCPDHVAVCGLMKLTAETEKTDGPGRRQALHNMFTVCFIVLLSIHHITRHRHLNAGQICCQRNSSWSQLNIQIQLYYKLFKAFVFTQPPVKYLYIYTECRVFRVLRFDLIPSESLHSSNKDNSDSNPVSLNLSIAAKAQLDLRG